MVVSVLLVLARRSEGELQEVVAITGVANHRERSVTDKALNGGASEWQTPERAV